jgi:ABC-type spermidine/putrescine transport system permease subunit I
LPEAVHNIRLLRAVARRERLIGLVLFAPILLTVGALLVIPAGWLLGLSFIDKGTVSFVNYARMLQYTSYSSILMTTFEISLVVTLICVALGYPTAYLIAQLPPRPATICLALIVIPFWTSLLVRTYAWLVLLNTNGPVNSALLALHLVPQPLDLVFNRTGTIIGMVHIMLPFLVLPLYSQIKSFDLNLLRAAASMGASPVSAFMRVFLPLSLPGISAGAILVFIQSLAVYVTPAILGGGNVTFAAMKIAANIQTYFEWGASSAFGMILLLFAFGVLAFAARFLGMEKALGVVRR